ncbi:Site-specific recombinase XerD [Maledivibacter halophilus]|uniref:Site-specific recombinase XerD n=1 Tax=Maledivibacter halophilus TaxID=36842 RepID=A0A1T5K0C0_9FIRM|nr:Site-specific recombinase XerD [Maledivibacter halophilus]
MNSDNFFATKKTGSLSAAYVNRVLNDTTKKLRWNKNISAHILRHSFASNLIKNGVNLVHVQKLLGHSNLKVTSVYTHANMEDLNRAINVL